MYIYSGDCRLGTVGSSTPFTDMNDVPLFVGDIVMVFNEGCLCGGLTAVVSDEFTTYSNGVHEIKDGPTIPFVMGIKSVSLSEPSSWAVCKVKDHFDVVAGEHWKAYGFSYKTI